MDDPGWSWPAWKFGMTRDDLSTKLHDQYNTIPSTLQDPEAFHHDVWEISHEASSSDEFHSMMAARKEQRIRELNESLESAAFEIIAHPKLVGTDQWQYALQLFRTKSLDSLVRYFASYLPEQCLRGHGYHTPSSISTASSFADNASIKTASTNPSSVGIDDHCHGMILTNHKDEHVFTQEPDAIHVSVHAAHLPSPPQSSCMPGKIESLDDAVSPPSDIDTHDFAIPTPARTMSFSGSESEVIPHSFSQPCLDDDESSQSESEALATSDADLTASRSSLGSTCFSKAPFADDDHLPAQLPMDEFDEVFDSNYPSAQIPIDSIESETPTPRQEAYSTSYMDAKCSAFRVQVPNRTPSTRSRTHQRRDCSPVQYSRRSPEELFSRIQKPQADPIRSRPRGRIRVG